MAINLVQQISMEVAGDGVTTAVEVDLTKPPVRLDISGNAPIGVHVVSPEGVSAGLTHSGRHVALTFTDPPPNFADDGTIVTVNLALLFAD